MTSKDDSQMSDWCPPWLDNGESLLEIVQTARHLDNSLSWQIIINILQRQMLIDLKIAREVNYMFNSDANEEALPYMWDQDFRIKNLGQFWSAFPEDYEDPDGDDDEDDE
jgi:hypothetical protein